MENHTVGDPSRFGIWADGAFAWTGDDGWDRSIAYEHETLVGDTTLGHPKLGVLLHVRDAVDFDRNLYFKEVTVEDTLGRERQVRLFQHFDAHLFGNDTATRRTTTHAARPWSITKDAGTSSFRDRPAGAHTVFPPSRSARRTPPARRGRGGTRRTVSSRAIRSRTARSIAWAWWPFQSRQRAARLP